MNRLIPFRLFLFCCALLSLAGVAWGSTEPTVAVEPPLSADAQPLQEVVETPFSMEILEERARDMATKPWENPEGSVPQFLLDLTYDQWRKLRFRPEASLWRDEGLPFEVQFFHAGMFYNRMVALNEVRGTMSRPIAYNAAAFTFGDDELAAKVSRSALNYAGFRLHYPINKPDYKDEVAVFLGASYFRAVAKGSQYGLSARGLAANTALPEGEEFPWFREFWIERPKADATSIVVYALLNSPSMTGAYRFNIVPGEKVTMDVTSKIFLRRDVAKLGVAPLTSMFLFNEMTNGQRGDYRPQVHDSDGLLVHREAEGWTWTPLNNGKRLFITSLPAEAPLGFGLEQRDTDFDHYQDLEARYDLRPSLWIEPKGNWGKGWVELVEIPTDQEINDNIVAFWVPAKTPAEQEGDKDSYPSEMHFDYRMTWTRPGVAQHNLGKVISTRTMKVNETTLRFILDFNGGILAELPEDAGLASVVTAENSRVLDRQLMRNPVNKSWRLVFSVEVPPKETLKNLIGAAAPVITLSAQLKKGENMPDALTETWYFKLRP